MKLLQQFRHARRVSVPIVAIETPDPQATVTALTKALTKASTKATNGKAPVVQWDLVRGCFGLNDLGQPVAQDIEKEAEGTQNNPVGFLASLFKVPLRTVAFAMVPMGLDDPAVQQAVWNLRDVLKADQRCLVLLAPSFRLPPFLERDVVVLQEELPEAGALADVVKRLDKFASTCPGCGGSGVTLGAECGTCGGSGASTRKLLKAAAVERAVEAIQGLAEFPAEQAVAMSLRPDGLDLDHLWEQKRVTIGQTPGLSVWRGGETFADVQGLDNIKGFVGRLLKGRERPRAIVWIDEIEKLLAGSSGQVADSSGVSQGILQSLLVHMQEQDSTGMIFVGHPGTGKSFIAKTAGNEGGIPTIAFDSNGMKSQFVGSSEQNMRTALKVVQAISNRRELWIATCNEIESLPAALKRRFCFGTFFFDLPTSHERMAMWKYYKGQLGVTDGTRVADEGWTGAEIRTCCKLAHSLDVTLQVASTYIVPVSQSDRAGIDELRTLAAGRFISASTPGPYKAPGWGNGRRHVSPS